LAHVSCLGVMIRASFVPSSAFQRALVGRWLARIGVASYSIYLVHLQALQIIMPAIVHNIRELPFPFLVVICVIFGLSIVVIVSLPFYWLIERPWVGIERRLSLNARTSEVQARKQELASN
jgi:peptidoglycan/LPS O-acetylase OafA/YrhL